MTEEISLKTKILMILSVCISLLVLLTSSDTFSHGVVFVLLGILSIIVALLGIFAAIMILLRKRNIGTFLLKIFSITGMLYSLMYMLIDVGTRGVFFGFFIIWLIIFILNKPTKNDQFEEMPKGKYLKLNWIVLVVLIIVVLTIVYIWVIDWEGKAKIMSSPNGGGISVFRQEGVLTDITVICDGAFVYDVSELKEDLLAEVTVKMIAPSANISILSNTTGKILLRILNMQENAIKVNRNEKNIDKINYDDFWNSSDEQQLIEFPISGTFLLEEKGSKTMLDVKANDETVIEIPAVESKDPLRIVVFSDTHSAQFIYMSVLAEFLDKKPNFVVWAGDITNNGYSIEFLIASAIAESYPLQVFTTMGNHDIWNRGDKYYNVYFGPYYYSFEIKDTKIIILDTSKGLIGDSQFDWLYRELKDNTNNHTIIISHMPPIDTLSGNFDTSENLHPEMSNTIHIKSESEYLIKLMNEFHVDAYIAGHTHQQGAIKINDTLIATSGALGGTVLPGDNVGYIILDVDEEGVHLENIDVMSVEEVNSNKIQDNLHAARVFVLPVIINKSIRIASTILLFLILSIVLYFLKDKLIYRK
ncbi:hypothetical protein COV13_01575 [Candidatus Woesearchaeota archaeon CG10_big_fil_rev_8_21_14_0_10_32_9]|nr:MAG: hypothetical protein COV13_01575 [Candidatus Woesearchaeota archaeon CG10_big_fil_rev_8_21_14_0_10_32_9]